MTLNIAYFPPVEYFAVLARYSTVFIEAQENYQKQSYRNRCRIYTSNGLENLSFPVKHIEGSFRIPIREIEIDYSTPWIAKTKRCIDTAYYSSAFFEYYRDSLYAILDTKVQRLWDLDIAITQYFIAKLGLTTELKPTTIFSPEDTLDIHPKHTNTILKDFGIKGSYYQVFDSKFGFQPNLSIMDLLFNEGPASLDYLSPSSGFSASLIQP